MNREEAIFILNNAGYVEPKKKPFKSQVKEYAKIIGDGACIGFKKAKEITCNGARIAFNKFRNNRDDIAVGAILAGSVAAIGTFIHNIVADKDLHDVLVINETTVNVYDDPFFLDDEDYWN